MPSFKTDRIAHDIKKELVLIFRLIKDPRVSQLISIVKVDLSKDLSVCKVYVSAMEGYEKTVETVKGLQSASGFIRREIANRLKIRKSPEFRFIADDSLEYSSKINTILHELTYNQPEQENEDISQDTDSE